MKNTESIQAGETRWTVPLCRICFVRAGGQTDLRGQIMASVCKDISLGWGEALLTDSENPAATGQDWFDIFRSNAEELQKQYSEDELNELYHASWLLLQVMQLRYLSE